MRRVSCLPSFVVKGKYTFISPIEDIFLVLLNSWVAVHKVGKPCVLTLVNDSQGDTNNVQLVLGLV